MVLPVVVLLFAGEAFAQRTVTLRLNTATAPDTLRTTDEIQVRGCLVGCSGDQSDLPGGDVIAWNDNTTLKPANTGGDYWEHTFQIPDDDTLKFKFYSQLLEDDAVGGWEDGLDHELLGGVGDTTLSLHYFVKGAGQAYDWMPFESKEDSVGVWFRVYMNTDDAVNNGGYVPSAEAPAQQIGVRGDDLSAAGPLNWGETKILLTRESTGTTVPGYNLYSGVAYYPVSLAGTVQAYKFVNDNDVLTDATLGWESGSDRTFTIPAQDSTLHWVYFGYSKPATGAEKVTSNLLFTVSLDPYESIGVFKKSRGDTLKVLGTFNQYGCNNPDLCLLSDIPATNDFEAAITLTLVPEAQIAYKYFLDFNNSEFVAEFGVDPPSGWEEGHATGVDRVATFAGTPEQDLGLQFFNDIENRNVIPEGTTINVDFSVDMSNTDAIRPFDPAGGDSVFVEIEDPIWAFTQGLDTFLGGAGDDRADIVGLLTDDDSDGTYTGTLAINGPTYGLLTFRYAYGKRTNTGFDNFIEAGSGLGTSPGRNRAYFIKSNPDGSWPSTYSLGEHTFQPEGALPFETNTVAVEQVGSDLPAAVTLQPNYPNPFSSSTSFEYTLTDQSDVRLSVYNVIGQKVAVVVDAVQPAGTFKANFEAGTLSSGTYFVRLEAGNQTITRSIVLVK